MSEPLSSASACGLLDGSHGADVVSRLQDTNDANFRSAMTECLACWFLVGKLKLSVSVKSAGAGGKVPDLFIAQPDGHITVEVKAPYTDPMPVGVFVGIDDSQMLAAAVDEANKQFEKSQRNVLLLVPSTKTGLLLRYQLLKAFFGEIKIVVPIDAKGGPPPAKPYSKFFPEGKFLKIWKDKPRFTRVSAVVCLREECVHGEGADGPLLETVWVDHHWVVLHNPYCSHPVKPELWGSCPQLVQVEGGMQWSDGRPIYV